MHYALRLICLCLLASAAVQSATAGSSSLMDISRDGRLLACANRDDGSVALFDLDSQQRTHLLPVGHHPEGITFVTDQLLAVAVYGDDLVKLIDTRSGRVTAEIPVFDEPYGVVASPDGTRLYVTLDYPGRLVEIDVDSKQVLRELSVGSFTRGIAMPRDGKSVYITEYYTGIVRQIDLDSGKPLGEWIGTPQDNLARQITLHPTRPKAYVPHQRSVVTNPQGAGAIFPYVAVINTDDTENFKRRRIQMDSFRGTYVTANPWEMAVSPDGQHGVVVFSGTNDAFVMHLLDDNYRELEYAALLQTGSNPRAVQYTPDGSRFAIYNALDFTIDLFDSESLRRVATLETCDCPLDEQMLLGKKLFYVATQPMVGRRWISCSSCHPDGQADGRTWQQPEGLRNTQSLAGMAWTHPIHWSADRDEVQDFEHTIRSPLMQGRGLIRGRVNDALGDPNRGRSRELDALARYANSHPVPLSPYAKNGLSEAARRGQRIFNDNKVGCATCHSGPYLCDSQPCDPADYRLHDVGTGNSDPSEKMGPRYDTPTLMGIYRTAPYLHHGKAQTLKEVLTTYNPDDRHGRTSHLSEQELDDLVAFLKSLPYEDVEPLAIKAGLQKVVD